MRLRSQWTFAIQRLSARREGQLVYKDLRYSKLATRLDDIPAVVDVCNPETFRSQGGAARV
jgi:hypothetical protein